MPAEADSRCASSQNSCMNKLIIHFIYSSYGSVTDTNDQPLQSSDGSPSQTTVGSAGVDFNKDNLGIISPVSIVLSERPINLSTQV